MCSRKNRWTLRLLLVLLMSLASFGQDKSKAPTFSEPDAMRLLDRLSQAMLSNDQRAFLKAFDPLLFPNFPSFRSQISDFFRTYGDFLTHYHVRQAVMAGGKGVLLTDFEFQATPALGDTPVRKQAQLRMVLVWDGKEWKIVGLDPRSYFS